MQTSAASDFARRLPVPNAYASADLLDVTYLPQGDKPAATDGSALAPVLTVCAALLAATPAAAGDGYRFARAAARPPVVADAATVGSAARQRFKELARLIADEPVDSMTSHPAEVALQAYINEFGASSLRARLLGSEQIGPSHVASVLMLIGRVSGVGEAEKIALLSTAVRSRSAEVRDAAIQAAELWADLACLRVLESYQDPAPWLDDYRRRAAIEIRQGLSDRV